MGKILPGRDLAKERFWREKLEEWELSGLTQAEFCRRNGLKENNLSFWKRVVRGPSSESDLKKASRSRIITATEEKRVGEPMTFVSLAGTAQPPKSKNLQMVLPNGIVFVIPVEVAMANLQRLFAAFEKM